MMKLGIPGQFVWLPEIIDLRHSAVPEFLYRFPDHVMRGLSRKTLKNLVRLPHIRWDYRPRGDAHLCLFLRLHSVRGNIAFTHVSIRSKCTAIMR